MCKILGISSQARQNTLKCDARTLHLVDQLVGIWRPHTHVVIERGRDQQPILVGVLQRTHGLAVAAAGGGISDDDESQMRVES